MGKVLVTGFKNYSFDDKNGKKIEGTKVSYLSEVKISNDQVQGHLPIQANVDNSVVRSLKEIPGIYEEVYEMVPGKNNAPTPKLVGLNFVKGIDFKGLFR